MFDQQAVKSPAAPASSRSGALPAARTTWLAALGAGVLMGSMILINVAVPWRPYVEGYTEKLEFFQRHGADYSILFVGSSRILAHVDPHIFDAAASAEGMQGRSFNLGVDALSLIELERLIEEVLAVGSPSLRFIFMEPTVATSVPLRNLTTERNLYFHDLGATRLEIACNLAAYPERWLEAVSRSARSCLYHYANLGRLTSFVFPREEVIRPRGFDLDLVASGGFRPQNHEPSPEVLRENQRMRDNLGFYVARMAAPRELPEARRFAPHARFYIDLAERIQAKGIQPVFLITPGFHNIDGLLEFMHMHERADSAVPMLSYVHGYDEIYRAELWFDPGHMKDQGARLFSRRLGRDAAHLIMRLGGASCCSSS